MSGARGSLVGGSDKKTLKGGGETGEELAWSCGKIFGVPLEKKMSGDALGTKNLARFTYPQRPFPPRGIRQQGFFPGKKEKPAILKTTANGGKNRGLCRH